MVVITLRITRTGATDVLLVNDIISISPSESRSISTFIRDEITSKRQNFKYSDEDIITCETFSGTNAKRILSHEVSQLLEILMHDDKKGLKVVIDAPLIQETTRKPTGWDLITSSTKQKDFESTTSLKDVQEFLNDFHTTGKSRTAFLTSREEKIPNITEQVESFVVEHLNKNNLGISVGEEEPLKKAVRATIAVFIYVHNHRETMSNRMSAKFQTGILDSIKDCVITKQKLNRQKQLTQGDLELQILKANKAFSLWPERYKSVKSGKKERKGEAILSEIENCVNIMTKYNDFLRLQAGRKKEEISNDGNDTVWKANNLTTDIQIRNHV